jgi:bacillithiol biosynthesis deacetylase BshB1
MKVDILAFGVHPDDIELACAGTLLKHKDLGFSFGICDLTQGELGTRGSAELRLIEAENSKKILGAEFRVNLKMKDGFFEINEESIIKVIEVIRKFKPDIVFANAVSDRHPDHGRAAKLISESCFYSGLIKIKTFENNVEQGAWRPKSVYHYIQDRNLKADFCVDISQYMEKKIESILAFSSQFKSDPNDGPQTPISGEQFYQFLYAKARAYGRDINVDYAEGFTVNRTIGINNIFNLI